MSVINHLGGVKRSFDHVKVVGADIDRPKYEGAMFIYKEERKGKSFCIPLSAMWKYIEPKDNIDARMWDQNEFNRIAQKVYFAKSLGAPASEWAEDAAAIVMAEEMAQNSGFLMTVAFGLVKCCQILDITVCGPSLAQLLMFIQDGLTELRTMPLHIPENTKEIGELTINLNDKITHIPLAVSESEQVGVL